jgi:hypothetical protein
VKGYSVAASEFVRADDHDTNRGNGVQRGFVGGQHGHSSQSEVARRLLVCGNCACSRARFEPAVHKNHATIKPPFNTESGPNRSCQCGERAWRVCDAAITPHAPPQRTNWGPRERSERQLKRDVRPFVVARPEFLKRRSHGCSVPHGIAHGNQRADVTLLRGESSVWKRRGRPAASPRARER